MRRNEGHVADILISRSSSAGTDEAMTWPQTYEPALCSIEAGHDRPRTSGEAAQSGISRATSANEDGDGPSTRGPSGMVLQLDLAKHNPWTLIGLAPADREECDAYTQQQINQAFRKASIKAGTPRQRGRHRALQHHDQRGELPLAEPEQDG